jgi:hypothetical protein
MEKCGSFIGDHCFWRVLYASFHQLIDRQNLHACKLWENKRACWASRYCWMWGWIFRAFVFQIRPYSVYSWPKYNQQLSIAFSLHWEITSGIWERFLSGYSVPSIWSESHPRSWFFLLQNVVDFLTIGFCCSPSESGLSFFVFLPWFASDLYNKNRWVRRFVFTIRVVQSQM